MLGRNPVLLASKYSLPSCYENFNDQFTKTKFEEKNRSFPFILSITNWEMTLYAKIQEEVKKFCSIVIIK